MENNSLTPSPMPTPDPGTNMPDFASAPAPAPVVPTTPQMPAFGMPQQPVMPMPPVAPAVPTQPVEPAQPTASEQQPTAEPAAEEQTPASDLGQIEDEPVAEPTPSPATPFVEAMSTTPTVGAPAPESIPTPEKKQLNLKLFAMIGAGVLLIVGGVIAAILLNQPKPTSNPTDVPQPTTVSVDTSVDFEDLTAEDAKVFLSATEAYSTFFPDDYAPDAVDYLGTSNLGIFYSYEKESDILKNAKEASYVEKFKDKITEDNTVIDKKDKYAFVSFSPEETGCKDNCLAIIFDKKAVNFYSEPYLDVLTGISSQIVHIMFIDHGKDAVEKYAPLVAAIFMNGEKVYSSKLTSENNGEFSFEVNSIKKNEYGKVVKKTTYFKIATNGEFLYLPDKTVETVL
jgi:hypothetical protein